MQFLAHTDGKVLVPDEPVDLPAGRRFKVTLQPIAADAPPPVEPPRWLRKAKEVVQRMPTNLPEDLAEQHDHYIHGTPKR